MKAGAVIIASGGFAANEDMLKTYTKAGPNMITFGSAGKTGDGIKMAWDKGATSEGVDSFNWLFRSCREKEESPP